MQLSFITFPYPLLAFTNIVTAETCLLLYSENHFMETIQVAEDHREYLQDTHLPQDVYLKLAYRAGGLLHWTPISVDADSITYRTRDYLNEQLITLKVGGQPSLSIKPVNEYYHDEALSRQHANNFKQVMARLTASYDKANRNMHPVHREKWGALLPSKSYTVTPYLVYANVLVFVAMVLAGLSPLHPKAYSLLQWGGNYKPAVLAGDWWRMLSYMFLHAGGAHLLGNTFGLLYIGMFLEPLIGKFRFGAAYVLTGICAGAASLYMHPASVGVGASGAIFGMYGIFLALLTTNHIEKTQRKTMLRSLLFFVVYNLMMGLQGNTDNAAHIGGLLSGMLIGYIYYPGILKPTSMRKQAALTSFLAVAVAAIAWISIVYTG
jgi:membrane associated rhomboid family serine protease